MVLGFITVTVHTSYLPFAILAVMVVVPSFFAVINPFEDIEATFLLELVYVGVSPVLEGLTIGFRCLFSPTGIRIADFDMIMLTAAGPTFTLQVSLRITTFF